MCGIVGYTGSEKAAPILVKGLEKLEYRGYDSAGLALFEGDGRIKVAKCKGRLAVLKEKINKIPFNGTTGIGHTRWATHGEPNDINSHPHISGSGNIAVVHNGIIENYMQLKSYLEAEGFVFVSETDTEVVAHLVEHYYRGDLVNAVMQAICQLEGSYALGVISKDSPGVLVAAKKDSPLIVGKSDSGSFIASDIPAILEYTRDVYILEDKDIVLLTPEEINFFDAYGKKAERSPFKIDWDIEAAEKQDYEHFMMKEICEEPRVIRDTLATRLTEEGISLESFDMGTVAPAGIEKIYIIACGTAYHAGVAGKYLFEKLARIPVEVDVASEFRYREPIISDKHLVIVISQSGETIDTLLALRLAKGYGAKTLALVNAVGSTISREADHVLYTRAGPEIAVASTKAYNAQLALLSLVALHFGLGRGLLDKDFYTRAVKELQKIPAAIEKVLQSREDIQRFASEHFNAKSIFFIGRGLDYALAMEGSLKLKEISYIHSEAYAGGELKHGTIALIEEGTLVVCALTQKHLSEKMISNIKEVKARGAVVMAIAPEGSEELGRVVDTMVTIADIDPLFAPVAAVTPMQLLAYYMAVQKGCDVDKPRNLAKSVTVE